MRVGTRDEWLAARVGLLAEEKDGWPRLHDEYDE